MYSRALAYYLIHDVVAFAIFQQYKRRNPKKRGGITEGTFSCSTAPIAFSIGTQKKDILKAIGVTERKGSGLRD